MNNLESSVNNLEKKLENLCTNDDEKWGMSLKELFRLALDFYKNKSGKAVHLSYEDNLKLIAYTQQAIHGPFDQKTAPPLGVLDVIGRDRRIAWQNLGPISKPQAMDGFIELLDRLCPSFKLYIEAVKRDKEEKLRKEIEEQKKQQQEALEKEKQTQEKQKQLEEQLNMNEIQKQLQLQEALNQQTYHQFMAYAEKQFPGNPEQQAILIKQLQSEHYHQYMYQLQLQFKANAKMSELTGDTSSQIDSSNSSKNVNQQQDQTQELSNSEDQMNLLISEEIKNLQKNTNYYSDEKNAQQHENDASDSGEYLVISPARMWTRSDISVFKEEVSAGAGDGVIHVGHGDTVTVRVPTHDDGNCIFWEFATDNYDIGFGVYFEWGKSMTNEVTVHVSESDDEDELYDDDDDEIPRVTGDIECGGASSISLTGDQQISRPPISIIVPVYRRECHNEVYVGSHNYPGEGVYLLKFDNSYSIWRSKTLYYRVYYERKVT